MTVMRCLNWMGSWRKDANDYPLPVYRMTDYLNGCHKFVRDVDPRTFFLHNLIEEVKKATGVLGGVALIIRYIGNMGQLVCVTNDAEFTKMLHFFEMFCDGVGYVYLSWEAIQPTVTYQFAHLPPGMYAGGSGMYPIGSSHETTQTQIPDNFDWLTEGLPSTNYENVGNIGTSYGGVGDYDWLTEGLPSKPSDVFEISSDGSEMHTRVASSLAHNWCSCV